LIKDLSYEVSIREFVVDSGKLVIENSNLYIQVLLNYSLPGLLASDELNFIIASDI
jgi:hypothetical protein